MSIASTGPASGNARDQARRGHARPGRMPGALVAAPYQVNANGCVLPLDQPGFGVEVDESFLNADPAIEGPAYV